MATPLERKVRQLDNDVQSIYEMIASVEATQRRHGNRLEEVAATQSEHTRVLAEHSVALADHSAKLDRIIDLLEQRP